MPSLFATLTLLGLWLLSFENATRPSPADKLTLYCLGAAFLAALIPKIREKLVESRDAATFFLLAAFCVVFQLADRAGPQDGFSLKFPFLPDDPFVISYAARLVVLGAICTFPAWWKSGGPSRAIGAALILILFLGTANFWFLSRYYPVGPTETLDPKPLVTLWLQSLSYGSLALICSAGTEKLENRRLIFRILPFALLILWARHFFIAPPVEADE